MWVKDDDNDQALKKDLQFTQKFNLSSSEVLIKGHYFKIICNLYFMSSKFSSFWTYSLLVDDWQFLLTILDNSEYSCTVKTRQFKQNGQLYVASRYIGVFSSLFGFRFKVCIIWNEITISTYCCCVIYWALMSSLGVDSNQSNCWNSTKRWKKETYN
jgi:hypothetical protein